MVTEPSAADADRKLKHRAALSSVGASAALTLVKLAAGLFSGSLALVSEAAHGAVDTCATLVTFFAVRESGKPADEDHPFGHEKFESVAALVQVFILLDVALVVVIEATRRLRDGVANVEVTPWVFGALALSIGVDLLRWRALRRIARRTGSDALAADATHFASDLVASLIVLVGLVAYAAGFSRADAIASFGVAAIIVIAAVQLARDTLGTLLDKAPEGLAPRLAEIARNVPGVSDVGDVRLRRMGGRTVGDMTIGLSRTSAAERALDIRHAVREALATFDPRIDVTVSAVPKMLDDETMIERVLVVAARRRLAIHHVTIQRVGDRVSISFDLELDGAMRHGEAHEIASALEAAIRVEIGPDTEVESHIEPLLAVELEGQDEPAAHVEAIAQRLADAATRGGVVSDIHNVRARRTCDGLVVNYHCRIDPARSVSAVHECVDAIEHAVREGDSSILRIVGHAEPARLQA